MQTCSIASLRWHVQALSLRDGVEADTLHVRADLAWDLLQDLLGKVATRDTLVELHELDDVTHSGLSS